MRRLRKWCKVTPQSKKDRKKARFIERLMNFQISIWHKEWMDNLLYGKPISKENIFGRVLKCK